MFRRFTAPKPSKKPWRHRLNKYSAVGAMVADKRTPDSNLSPFMTSLEASVLTVV